MSRAAPPKPPADTSSDRNQYIPSFIAEKPFWAGGDEGDYLEHQRLHAEPKDTLDKAKWYDRGKKAGPAATKFRKGACENCGAMTHKKKDCLSRPRKQGANITGRNIQADEVVEDVKLGWDAKRDRWNGFDAREYSQVVRDKQELERLEKAVSSTPQPTDDPDSSTPQPDADAKYGEETDMGRSQPTSTRQLRLREDTAKYLLDLNLDSAKYDPKTRSMDTTAQTLSNPSASADDIVSDGFTRPTGDAEAFERAQRYAWETQENADLTTAQKLHLQANPTEGAVLLKKREADEAERKIAREKYLFEKYGTVPSSITNKTSSSSSTTAPPKAITASEAYTEYDATGRPKNAPITIPRSKYPEDVHPNNHTSVFGSWWRNFQWGYSCCHSTVKNSYCTGEEGKEAFEVAEGRRTGRELLLENGDNVDVVGEEEKERLALQQNGEDVAERKDASVADTTSESLGKATSKKRTLQEIQSGVTEEDMEAYKRNKLSAEDPMSSMLGRDELV